MNILMLRSKGLEREVAITARTAKASDFDNMAQKHANAFWLFLIISISVFYFFQWWGVIPFLYAFFCAFNSVMCTKNAEALRGGVCKTLNPNNGKDI